MKRYLFAISLVYLLAAPSMAIMPLPYPLNPFESTEPKEWERDPRTIEGYSDLYSGSQLREMELPIFRNPANTLGYSEGASFMVPKDLRKRVDFWETIFSKYDTSQAIIHDTKYLDIVYKVVDLSHITKNKRHSKRTKRRLINRLLRKEKKQIKRELLTLDAHRDDPLKIPLELFKTFKKFETISSKSKFLAAATRVRAQRGLRDRMVKGFFYGGRYFHKMMAIFEEEGVPKELTRLPLVESGFDLSARSKVGASGIWQFTRATGKRFMRIDRYVDERNDPLRATRAAAQLLKRNYERLKSWPLAVTAYNHGREGMATAVRVLATKRLSEIIDRYRSRTFGFASSNFYASFLAILEMERDYRKYFGKLMVDSPIEFDSVETTKKIKLRKLASTCNAKERDILRLNPGFRRRVTRNRDSIPKEYMVRLPKGKGSYCDSNLIGKKD